MTYGDCARELREGLSWLLNHSAPDAGDGVLVARYRDAVLGFSAEATTAASSSLRPPADERGWRARDMPTRDLAERLEAAAVHATWDPSMSTLLATPHPTGGLRQWQAAAIEPQTTLYRYMRAAG